MPSSEAARSLSDLVDETDPERGCRVEPLAGDEVATRSALADLPDRVRRDHGRDDAELDLREGERSALVCDRDVRGRDEAGAATEGVALDQRDHRGRTGIDRVEHAPERVRVRHVLVVRQLGGASHPVDVGSSAEALPLACDDDRARLADVDECLRQLLDEPRVEGVPRFGARKRDAEHVAFPLDPERSHDTAV